MSLPEGHWNAKATNVQIIRGKPWAHNKHPTLSNNSRSREYIRWLLWCFLSMHCTTDQEIDSFLSFRSKLKGNLLRVLKPSQKAYLPMDDWLCGLGPESSLTWATVSPPTE